MVYVMRAIFPLADFPLSVGIPIIHVESGIWGIQKQQQHAAVTQNYSPKKYKIQKVFIKMTIFLIYHVKVNFTPNTTIMDQNISPFSKYLHVSELGEGW